MSTAELARLCAESIDQCLADRRFSGAERRALIVEYVSGAITRALEEAATAHEVVHVHGSLGAVDVKVSRSTQGVAVEVDCKRPREPGESYEQAGEASARIAAGAYAAAVQEIAALGLTPGKDARP